MKKFLVLALLINGWAFGSNFEDERLNALYDRLQQQNVLQKQSLSSKAMIIYLVGADGACQYSLIKDAITQANLSGDNNNYEIRVAHNKTYTENLLISRSNLTLKGGYADCAKANIDEIDNSKTELDASGAVLPAIILRNLGGTQHNNNVYNFDISGGTNTATIPSGGVSIMDDNIQVHIETSFIHANSGSMGGGLYVEGASSEVFLKDTLIFFNDSTNGGGLYCDGADVFVYKDSGISLNNAVGTFFDGSGGGVYLTNGCGFNLFSGTSGGFLDLRGIAGNIANRDGGGMYVEDGAQVLLMGYLFIGEFGNNDQPVNITGNKANNSAGNRSGGGIYAKDSTTNITAYATIINNNETLAGISSSAAGMYILQADFSIGKLNSVCWDQQKCNQISGNKVSGVGSSNSGIMALSGSDITIKNTWISGHSAQGNVFIYGQSIKATIEGNVFTGNGGPSVDGNTSLLSFWNDSVGHSVAYNIFVNNEVHTSLLEINQSPNLKFVGNVVKEDPGLDMVFINSGDSSGLDFECSIVHEDQSFSGFQVFVDDPEFVDEVNEDFHILSTSPAIDLCGTTSYTPTTKDIDDEDRGWDDLLTDNIGGAFDAGIDEYYPITTADLSVSKILQSSAPYYVGESVSYQIIVTNNGSDAAANVHVEDAPTGMTITDVQSTNCSSFPCVIPSLAIGNSEIIAVTAKLRSTEGLFDNSVFVYSEDYDPDTSNNTDNTGNGGAVVLDHVDMEVSAFNLTTAAPYHSGQIITVQIAITNNGPDTARNVVIGKTTLSLNTQVINVTGAPCFQLPCNIAAFASGVTVNLTLSVKIVTGGSFKFGVVVGADSTDDDLTNNSENTGDLIAQNTGDLSINATLVTLAPYTQGQAVEVSLTVQNNGPNAIGMIEVSSMLSSLSITSVIGAGCTSLPCGSLVLNNSESLSITVMATITSSGEFSLAALVDSSNSFDPQQSDNSSTVMGTAQPLIDDIFADSFED